MFKFLQKWRAFRDTEPYPKYFRSEATDDDCAQCCDRINCLVRGDRCLVAREAPWIGFPKGDRL